MMYILMVCYPFVSMDMRNAPGSIMGFQPIVMTCNVKFVTGLSFTADQASARAGRWVRTMYFSSE